MFAFAETIARSTITSIRSPKTQSQRRDVFAGVLGSKTDAKQARRNGSIGTHITEKQMKLTQRDRVLRLLVEANGREVELLDILALRIGQYNARILELRAEGHDIRNRMETRYDGVKLSWYRLVPKAGQQQLSER